MVKNDKLIIFDTTLRDGEQAPGATMNLEEKILVAKLLEKMKVDVIEAGFAAASDGDFKAINEVATIVKDAVVCSLSRARKFDIERAGEAVAAAKRGRIHTFIATSPIHMKYKLKMDEKQVLEAIGDSVSLARNLCDDVEWSCEDATRSDREFLYKAIETAISCGATTINVPDTVGYAIPAEYADLIKSIRDNVANIDKAVISVHCHDDLGLAVANSLAGVGAGARQVECAVNGIGERAGNTALEEVVMTVKVRSDMFDGVYSGVDSRMITRASNLVSNVTSFPVQYNKAIVGANAFAHESGIHQDGMLKNRETYEIMTPESVGLEKSSMVIGKHSGRAAFKDKLKELGYDLRNDLLEDAFVRFKKLADRKKEIMDGDVIALVDDSVANAKGGRLSLVSLGLSCGTTGKPTAELAVGVDGKVEKVKVSSRHGPVDAIFKGISKIASHDAELELYQVHAVTGGTDAQAEVTVRLRDGRKTVSAHSANTDTLVASAVAYLNCLNRLL